jgi:hypothetical protein
VRNNINWALLCLAFVLFCRDSHSEEQQPTIDDLRREVNALRQQISERSSDDLARRIGHTDPFEDSVRGPATTKNGKLRIGGLVQVWAYAIQNDNLGLLDADQAVPGTGTAARNEEADNDSFRIRRAELRFDLDIHPNISAHVMIDAAREASAYPALTQNQGSSTSGESSVSFFDPCLCSGFIDDPRQIAAGAGAANRLLQDAYINYHGVVPHHDFSIGQMKRHIGNEGTRDNARLSFAERALITQPAEVRDIGALMHGTWVDDRVQYWAGAFNGSGTAFQQRSNRSDDNDAKDALFSLAVQPVRKHECFGTLEIGYSILYGIGGEAGGHTPGTNPVNGLNRRETVHTMQYAWASYRPAGVLRGWWMEGEWGNIRDRFAPNEVFTGLDVLSTDPAPFSIQGWYVATGYKLGESCWEGLPSSIRNIEFAFRYECMENLFFHDLVAPERRFNVYKTQVYTAGVNYYVKGDSVKLQLNYNWVNEEDSVDRDDRQFREVQNNNVVLNLQVAF